MEEVSTTSRQERIRKLLVISLSVTLKNVSDLLGDETAKEILSIIHNESFDVEVFKRMIKSVEDCYTITKGIMHTYKDD
jgi:ribonuclease D